MGNFLFQLLAFLNLRIDIALALTGRHGLHIVWQLLAVYAVEFDFAVFDGLHQIVLAVGLFVEGFVNRTLGLRFFRGGSNRRQLAGAFGHGGAAHLPVAIRQVNLVKLAA